MSGHSKWATIKHAKGAADAKRGKMFSRLAKEIMLVAKSGGDPNTNPSLRNLIAKAKGINMPKDNIDRAIKKGTGELQAEALEEITYEGYVGTVGLVVQVLTDNKNRAAAEIRNIFKKNNSELGQSGSVTRNFERKGQILLPKGDLNEDDVMMLALDAGADDQRLRGRLRRAQQGRHRDLRGRGEAHPHGHHPRHRRGAGQGPQPLHRRPRGQ